MPRKYPRSGIMPGTQAARTRGRLARAHSLGSTSIIPDLEAQLLEDITADFLSQVLATAPPLSAEARARLAGLLTAGEAR